ncbi:MAG: hypothetical protein AB7E70_20305 [Hyphomicrobiaceae bacterium]
MQINPYPLLRTWTVKTPAATKDDEAPDPIIRVTFEFDMTMEALKLLGTLQRAGGACRMTLEPLQGSFAFERERETAVVS